MHLHENQPTKRGCEEGKALRAKIAIYLLLTYIMGYEVVKCVLY